MSEKKISVSPVNGQPTPSGRRFTTETAREAQRIRSENARARKSITTAFLKGLEEVVGTYQGKPLTGAQAIAKAIIKGAADGKPEMVKIALSMAGETPKINDSEFVEAVKVIIDV